MVKSSDPLIEFRCQFWWIYFVLNLWVMVAFTFIFSVLLLYFELSGNLLGSPVRTAALMITMATTSGFVLLVPTSYLLMLLARVQVSPTELHSADEFGLRMRVSWNTITDVKPFVFLGLPYLRIYSTETRRVVWLPVFLGDYERFVELVRDYAGPEHPLTLAVVARLPVDD